MYQRGAHTIWEVDGTREKVRVAQIAMGSFKFSFFLIRREQLYCQNLSLFGKLFIDIKTLFFDCDNCERLLHPPLTNHVADVCIRAVLFYIFTDADSQRDHVLGFFSKVNG